MLCDSYLDVQILLYGKHIIFRTKHSNTRSLSDSKTVFKFINFIQFCYWDIVAHFLHSYQGA